MTTEAQVTLPIIATGISSSALAGAICVLTGFYLKTAHNLVIDESVEEALQVVFTTVITAISMIAHLILNRVLAPTEQLK